MKGMQWARFGVFPRLAPHNCSAFKRKSRMRHELIEGLESAAAIVGSDPSHWYVSFVRVPLDQCTVEFLDEGVWIPDPV